MNARNAADWVAAFVVALIAIPAAVAFVLLVAAVFVWTFAVRPVSLGVWGWWQATDIYQRYTAQRGHRA